MSFTRALRVTEKLISDNSPLILTVVGVTGTVATAILTGKATYDSVVEEFMDGYETLDWKTDLYNEYTAKKRIKRHWKRYVPAVATGVLTVAAVVGANRIGTRRAAGLAAAFSLSERAAVEYREKVVEKFGQNKEREVRDEIAQDRVNRNPEGSREIVIVGTDVLCHDAFSGRYFQSSMETLRKAQNDLNAQVLNNMYASLSDFYDLIGLTRTDYSDEIGWNVNNTLELKFSTVMSEDGRPCLSFSFDTRHIRDYYKIG